MKNTSKNISTLTKALLALSLFISAALIPVSSSAQSCGILGLVTCSDNAGGTAPAPAPAPAPTPSDDVDDGDCDGCTDE